MNPSRRLILIILIPACGLVSVADAQPMAVSQTQAVALYRQGRFDAAAVLYQRVVAREPDNRGAVEDLLWAQWLGHNYADAAATAQRLTVLSPKNFNAWLILGQSSSALGHKEDALRAFERCRALAPHEKNVQFAIARVESALKNYDKAIVIFERLIREDPSNAALYPELARAQQLKGDTANAVTTWARALILFPDHNDYRFHEAESLYYSGDRASAMEKLNALATATPPYRPALEFLANDAIARGDVSKAEQWFEIELREATAADEPQLLQLADLYTRQGKNASAIDTLDRCLALNPMEVRLLLRKADVRKAQGRYRESIALYQQAIDRNPHSLKALLGLADAQSLSGHPQEALTALDRARTLDPTDPYLLVWESEYQYEKGDSLLAHQTLTYWLDAHRQDPTFAALLYHGLTNYNPDPELASASHRPTAVFEDHMAALHQAGYTAITPSQVKQWLAGENPLPAKSILITFDDARSDSFQNADPILKKYGFRAVMFAALVNVEGYFSNYAAWPELEQFAGNGRWSIESHGDLAHAYEAIDAQGHQGLFLLHPLWLKASERLETTEEWKERLRRDYAHSKEKITQHTGETPAAYAFPEGDYGQQDGAATADADSFNLSLARNTYSTAYHEDGYGMNGPTRDPVLLTRLEPEPDWTGAMLVRYLNDHTPALVMHRQMFRWAVWEGRYHEAGTWLSAMKQDGASQESLLVDEAGLRLAMGDSSLGQSLVLQALRENPSPEDKKWLSSQGTTTLSWNPTFLYQNDNRDRERWQFLQTLGEWHTGAYGWSVHQLVGAYHEGGVETVGDVGGGIGVERSLGLSHRLGLVATAHHLTSTTAQDTYSLVGSARSAWTDNIQTYVEGGRTIYDTARAIDANVVQRYGDVTLFWTPVSPWAASVRDRYTNLSDSNQRYTEIFEVSRKTIWPFLRGIARFTADDMDHVSPDYYSPQSLREYQAGFDASGMIYPRVKANLEYMPGVGTENGTGAQFIQDVDAGLAYQVTTQWSLRPSFNLAWTPTYRRDTYFLELLYNFK